MNQTNSHIDESCSLIPFTSLLLGDDKDTVSQENANLIAQATYTCCLSITFQCLNNSGYTVKIGAIRNIHIRIFFELHSENKTAQTISHQN